MILRPGLGSLLIPLRHALGPKYNAEGKAMERFIQLNLKDENEKIEAQSLPREEQKEPTPAVFGKRLHRFVNKAAHKAAGEYNRNRSGLISK